MREEAVAILAEVGVEALVGTMIEMPRAALTAGQIAEAADFFSFGTNDLTQMGWGFSRDDVEAAFFSATSTSASSASARSSRSTPTASAGWCGSPSRRAGPRSPGCKVGVCGEHGGDPDSVHFFHDAGLDYVSCSPFRVPVARLEAGRAAGAGRPGRRTPLSAGDLRHPLAVGRGRCRPRCGISLRWSVSRARLRRSADGAPAEQAAGSTTGLRPEVPRSAPDLGGPCPLACPAALRPPPGRTMSGTSSVRRAVRRSVRGIALLAVTSVLLTLAATSASAATGDRVDLRVLVVSNGGSNEQALLRELADEGVPTTVVPLGSTLLTPSFLADTVGGVARAKFQAVVLPGARGLLTEPERVALSAYEVRFGVREVNAYVYPGSDVGTTVPTSGGRLDGRTATVTSAGRADAFRYLRGPVTIDDDSPTVDEVYGYLGQTPVATPTTSFTPLVTVGGSPIIGEYREAAASSWSSRRPSTPPRRGSAPSPTGWSPG